MIPTRAGRESNGEKNQVSANNLREKLEGTPAPAAESVRWFTVAISMQIFSFVITPHPSLRAGKLKWTVPRREKALSAMSSGVCRSAAILNPDYAC